MDLFQGLIKAYLLHADKPFISNTLTSSFYHSFSENIVGASKIYLSTINGLNDEDVRLSKEDIFLVKGSEAFKEVKLDRLMGQTIIGGNYALL